MFKRLQDLNSEIMNLNCEIDPDYIEDTNTEELLRSICVVLGNSYFANYYEYKYKNGLIHLFTLNGKELDISTESKFLIEVYKVMYGREKIDPREFSQFVKPSSYSSHNDWHVEGNPFEYWCIDLKVTKSTLTATMRVDYPFIIFKIQQRDRATLVPFVYKFKDLVFVKKYRKQIVSSLKDLKVPVDQIMQYKELCTIFKKRDILFCNKIDYWNRNSKTCRY